MCDFYLMPDRVFDPDCSTKDVFEATGKHIAHSVVDGFNGKGRADSTVRHTAATTSMPPRVLDEFVHASTQHSTLTTIL